MTDHRGFSCHAEWSGCHRLQNLGAQTSIGDVKDAFGGRVAHVVDVPGSVVPGGLVIGCVVRWRPRRSGQRWVRFPVKGDRDAQLLLDPAHSRAAPVQAAGDDVHSAGRTLLEHAWYRGPQVRVEVHLESAAHSWVVVVIEGRPSST
jgi:hypothetical protein